MKLRGPFALALLVSSWSFSSNAGVVEVVIDTSLAQQQAGALSLELVGSPGVDNSVAVNDFTTDGIIGIAETAGGLIVGDIILGLQPAPLTTINDDSFYNRLTIPFTSFGSSVTFALSLTENEPSSFSSDLEDQFSMFLLNDLGTPGLDTSDPLGAEAIASIDIDGSAPGRVEAFSPATFEPSGPGGVPRITLALPALTGGSTPLVGDIKLKAKLKFNKTQRDSIQLKIKDLELPAGFVAAGADLTLDVSGLALNATLDAKGKFRSSDKKDRLSLKQSKSGAWKLSLKRKKGDFAGSLEDDGMGDEDNRKPGKAIALRVSLETIDETFASSKPLAYKSKSGKSGTAN